MKRNASTTLSVLHLLLWLGVAGCGSGGSGAQPAAFGLVSATALSETQVELRFSAPVDASTASHPDGFRIDGLPLLGAGVDPVDPARVVLDTFFQLEDDYEVHVLSVRSQTGEAPVSGRTSAPLLGAGLPAPERTDSNPPVDLPDLISRGWMVVDDTDATTDGPSDWSVSAGAVRQASNIYGGARDDAWSADRPGTYLIYGGSSLQDGFIRAVLRNSDDDAVGLIQRYADPGNYYRFEWDRQRRRQRLVRVLGGVPTTLAFDTTPYEQDTDYEVAFGAVGDRLFLLIDGVVTLTVRDDRLAAGLAGVFCWGSDGLVVKDVVIQSVLGAMTSPFGAVERRRPDAPMESHAPLAAEVAFDGVMLWVRAHEPCSVHFELSTDPDFLVNVLSSPVKPAESTTDLTATHGFDALLPETSYYARAILTASDDPVRHNRSSVATFRTAPDPSVPRDVVFAFGADFHQDYPERLTILERILQNQPAFFLNLGDLPYTDADPEATTQAAYRAKHQELRSFDVVERFFRLVPSFATWDDHEVLNDWDGATDPGRVALGTGAWKEYVPYRPTAGSGGAIYRSFRWGAALEVFLLDTRFHRDPNSDPDTASKTMLGAGQKQWLLDGLSASPALFKCVVTSVPLRSGVAGNDYWAGFTQERSEIFDHVSQNAIAGVFFLSGDQHFASAYRHPEGFIEVAACPISARLFSPPSPLDPNMSFAVEDYTYGVVRLDAAAATGSIEIRDNNGLLLHAETIP